jgi:hypothetical protein
MIYIVLFSFIVAQAQRPTRLADILPTTLFCLPMVITVVTINIVHKFIFAPGVCPGAAILKNKHK